MENSATNRKYHTGKKICEVRSVVLLDQQASLAQLIWSFLVHRLRVLHGSMPHRIG